MKLREAADAVLWVFANIVPTLAIMVLWLILSVAVGRIIDAEKQIELLRSDNEVLHLRVRELQDGLREQRQRSEQEAGRYLRAYLEASAR